jgi:hypothetical protein
MKIALTTLSRMLTSPPMARHPQDTCLDCGAGFRCAQWPRLSPLLAASSQGPPAGTVLLGAISNSADRMKARIDELLEIVELNADHAIEPQFPLIEGHCRVETAVRVQPSLDGGRDALRTASRNQPNVLIPSDRLKQVNGSPVPRNAGPIEAVGHPLSFRVHPDGVVWGCRIVKVSNDSSMVALLYE